MHCRIGSVGFCTRALALDRLRNCSIAAVVPPAVSRAKRCKHRSAVEGKMVLDHVRCVGKAECGAAYVASLPGYSLAVHTTLHVLAGICQVFWV